MNRIEQSGHTLNVTGRLTKRGSHYLRHGLFLAASVVKAKATQQRVVVRKAENVARRLGTKVKKFIYKQIWKGVNIERWAVAAEEIRHDKPGQSREKHFAWLCLNEKRLAV